MSSPMTAPDVVGLTEFATMAGVERSTVSAWMRRGKSLPPHTSLSCGPVWRRGHVIRWIAANRVDATTTSN